MGSKTQNNIFDMYLIQNYFVLHPNKIYFSRLYNCTNKFSGLFSPRPVIGWPGDQRDFTSFLLQRAATASNTADQRLLPEHG